MLARLLRRESIPVGRRHVRTLMKRMGIEALYRRPNTSRKNAAHKIFRSRSRYGQISFRHLIERSFLPAIMAGSGPSFSI